MEKSGTAWPSDERLLAGVEAEISIQPIGFRLGRW
jgi:hypothetical protein